MGGEESADLAEDLSTLVSSTGLVVVGSFLGAGSKLLEEVIIARVLDPAAYGRVSVGISILMLAVTFALVGFNQGIPRYMSRFDTDADARGAWLTGLAVAGVGAVVITAALFFTVERLPELFEANPSAELLVPFVLAIPFVVLLRVGVAAIRGHENTIYRTYSYDLLYNVLRLGLLVGLLFAGAGVLAAGYAYLLAGIVAAAAAHVLLDRLLALRGAFRTHTREMVLFSLPLVISTSVTVLFGEIDTLMLAVYVDAGPLGWYNAAYALSQGLGLVLSAFGFLYMPLTSRLDAAARREEVDDVYTLTTKWVFVVAFPVFLVLVAFPSDVIELVFGRPEYRAGGAALVVLTTGFFVSAAYGRCQDTLSAFGYTTYILAVNTVAAAFNILMNVALIPPYGIIGAAIASATSFAGLNGLAFAVLWYKTGISPVSSRTIRTFVFLPLILLPPSFALSQVVSLSWVTLPVVAAAAVVATVVVVAVTGCLQPEDEIPIDLIEDRLGMRVPYIRRYIPDEE